MSVYASKRSESKVEFLRVAQQLAVYTLKQVKKFPKSYRFNLTNDITKLAMEIHENVLRANSIYVHKGMTEDEFRLRAVYFTKAKSAIYALSSLLTITFSLALEGNNFLGDKKTTSNMFKEWARLLNYETALIKGVVDSDKKRFKSYQKGNQIKEKISDIPTIDNEIVLPEETFDLVESEN